MKPTKMDGSAPFLPEEIIRNILKRLPVKSLMRFRCVCRHWKNLFESESFIADHLHHSNHQNPSLLFQPKRQGEYISQLYLLDRGMQVLEIPSIHLFDASQFSVIGSSNGLLCVEFDVGMDTPVLLLCNPATRSVIKLPWTEDAIEWECHFGFGYSPIINDYKVVKTYAEHSDYIGRVEGYSLSTGSWEEHFDFLLCMRFVNDAITANGFMFWIGLRLDWHVFDPDDSDIFRDTTWAIVSFDIASEKFSFVSIPALGNNSIYHLMLYGDKIAIFDHDGDAESGCLFNLWVMEEPICASTLGRQSWTKIFSSSCTAAGLMVPAIFWGVELVYNIIEVPELDVSETQCETENGVNTVMCLLNTTTNEIKVFATRGCGDGNADVFNYSESLVPVDKIAIE